MAKHIANHLSALLWSLHTLGKPQVYSHPNVSIARANSISYSLVCFVSCIWHLETAMYSLSAIQSCRWGGKRCTHLLPVSKWEMPLENQQGWVPRSGLIAVSTGLPAALQWQQGQLQGELKEAEGTEMAFPRKAFNPFHPPVARLLYCNTPCYHAFNTRRLCTDVHTSILFSFLFAWRFFCLFLKKKKKKNPQTLPWFFFGQGISPPFPHI